MTPVTFSKLNITGPLTPSMPYIVLAELAFEKKYMVDIQRMNDPSYYIKVFKKVSKIKPKLIHSLLNQQEYNMVVDIINPFCNFTESKWTVLTLERAFHFLKTFENIYQEPNLYTFSNDTPYGLQTPASPLHINACIFYGYCRFKNVQVPLDITYHALRDLANQIFLPPLRMTTIMLEDTSTSDYSVEDGQWSYFSSRENESNTNKKTEDSPEEEFHFEEQFSNIQYISELFGDIQYLRNHFQPVTHEQAVVASSLFHQRDISKVKYPLSEFKYYDLHKVSGDHHIREIEKYNPAYIDLCMYFNPYLPKTLYKNEIIDHHLELFSYSSHSFISLYPYEILQELYLEQTFHLGWHPNIINNETPVELDTIEQLTNEEIVCYGVRLERNGLKMTTWRELYLLFKNTNEFVNPFEKNSIFPKNKIERLHKLGKWILNPSPIHQYLFLNYKQHTIHIIRDLLYLIDNMLLFQNSEFEIFKSYREQYENLSDKNKQLMKESFEKLFEVVMYMRGWTPGKHYPIDTHVSNYDQELTEKYTLDKIIDLDVLNEKSNGFIYLLPLIIWKDEFITSKTSEQGLTIGDRIHIVKNGNESDNINSCIRLTSNVLGASYCFYCKLFQIPEKFDIKNLIYIL
jgi:hypothetical protein